MVLISELIKQEQEAANYGDKPPPLRFVFDGLKSIEIDELLPLLIILAHRKEEVAKFYDRLMTFIVDLAKTGQSNWVGNLMSLKLTVNVMERFGLIPLGVAASYDAGISWAFATAAGTEIFSDIQVSNIISAIKEPRPLISPKK